MNIANEAFVEKEQKIDQEFAEIQVRVQSLNNDLLVPQLQETLNQSYSIAKQNCELLKTFYYNKFQMDIYDELYNMIEDK